MGGYRRIQNQLFNEFPNISKICFLAVLAGTVPFCANADAQRARFDDFFASQSSGVPAPARTLQTIPGTLPNTNSIITTPQQPFTQPGVFRQASAPTLFQDPVLAPPNLTLPNFSPPNLTQPNFDPYQIQNQPFPVFPQGNQQLNPNVLQPPQYGTQPSSQDWPQDTWQSFKTDFLPRVIEHPRARYTYIPGNGGNELGINAVEIATTLNWARFWGGPTPLKFTPGFIFNYWSGPDSTIYPQFDLPARAYSTFLAMDHITDPSKVSGIETNLTVGYYSDFNNTSSNAIRLTGKLLGWYRLNCYTIGKFGIEYFDRVNVKLLPAMGLYMTPNPDIKWDLYFPKSKLAHRIPNINDYEAWAYIGAEYGGGSWAIERRDGTNDQVDINDTRAYLGVEWMGTRGVTGFFEFGYAFDREIVYRSNALLSLELQDALMFRTGFAF